MSDFLYFLVGVNGLASFGWILTRRGWWFKSGVDGGAWWSGFSGSDCVVLCFEFDFFCGYWPRDSECGVFCLRLCLVRFLVNVLSRWSVV